MSTNTQSAIILAKGYDPKKGFVFNNTNCRAVADAGFTHVLVDYSSFNDTQFDMLKGAGLLPVLNFTRVLRNPEKEKEEKTAVRNAISQNNQRQGSTKTLFLTSGEVTDRENHPLMDRWNTFVTSIPNSVSYMIIRSKPNDHPLHSDLLPHATNIDFIGVNRTNRNPVAKSKISYDDVLIRLGKRVPASVFYGEWIYTDTTGIRINRMALVSGTRTLWYWIDGHINNIFTGSSDYSKKESDITETNTFAKNLFSATEQSTFSGPQTDTSYVDECTRIDAAPGKLLTVSKTIWYRSSDSPRYYYLVYNPSKETITYNVRFRYRLKDTHFRIMGVQGQGVARTAYKEEASIERSGLTLWRVAYVRE